MIPVDFAARKFCVPRLIPPAMAWMCTAPLPQKLVRERAVSAT